MGFRIGIAIAPENALPSAFVVLRGIDASIPKVAKWGYDGVELSLYNRNQIDVQHVKHLLRKYHLSVSAIATGQIFAQLGIYFTSSDQQVRRKAEIAFMELIDVASEFGAMINIGRIRGTVDDGETLESARSRFIESAHNICDHAKKRGVIVVLEPVNRYEINFIRNLEEGAALMKEIDRPEMRLMPDLFHMNIEDPSICGSLVRYFDYIGYIHLADSNRYAPGMGHLPFSEILGTLKALDYNGWVSVEVLPEPDPDTAAEQAILYLRGLI